MGVAGDVEFRARLVCECVGGEARVGQGELPGSVVANRCPGARPGFPGSFSEAPGRCPTSARWHPSLLQAPLRAVGYPLHLPMWRASPLRSHFLPSAPAPDSWRRESQRPCRLICFRRFRENAALWQPVLRGGLSWMADERNMRGRQMGNAALIWGNTCC